MVSKFAILDFHQKGIHVKTNVFENVEQARTERDRLHDEWWQERVKDQKSEATQVKYAQLQASTRLGIEQFGKANPDYPDCQICIHQSVYPGGPNHKGSPRCQCFSIASGGTRSHCSCDTCF